MILEKDLLEITQIENNIFYRKSIIYYLATYLMIMKNIFTLLLMISILVSCSDWKYSNGVKRQQKTYSYLNQKTPSENEIVAENNLKKSTSVDEFVPENQIGETIDLNTIKQNLSIENVEDKSIIVKTKKLEQEEDSIKPEVNQAIAYEAQESEEKGRKSRNFGVAGLILQITYIFGVVGLVLSIIGLIKGIQSLRADYNTPKGVKMARTGVILSSITIGIYLLSIIAILILIIAFL